MLQQFAFKQQALLNSKITNERHKSEKNKIDCGKDIHMQYENWKKKVENRHV